MSAPSLPNAILMIDPNRLPVDDPPDFADRGIILTRPTVEQLWDTGIRISSSGRTPAHARIPFPVVDLDALIGSGQRGRHGRLLIPATRLPAWHEQDLRDARWHWPEWIDALFLDIEHERGWPESFPFWEVMSASLALGPVEDMRRHLRRMIQHPDFGSSISLPPQVPALFAEVLDDPMGWSAVLTNEEITLLLEHESRRVREGMIAGGLRRPVP